ncbi:phosphatidate cytidylyltransferase : CDP-diglyceride synthetase OS=Singulisphaera acidiphila (strain ATCC BAA-1392 / DSM 18658 / VKM B-2454 / MOB10) GN=Sinac_6806 PE=4 SV=1: CTP_transf_1 [Gemmataceae bacterium]|nr:phosphatidate cytidylyltransferase : CDP-diglyceride synthetase OS=Singulisphaera acidiphila (strain ATCC BAA-1392 / DSM 18658 / VKM B-2454 / MOB10) GN=Sinac_6806 PE=4 SV=1: CTP_transf_1 [Gemmataceae bacterium]VTT97358.1 phosphatidate cytidylyltransferase : CDP-diglyceride synthetase OS=Singulisphaera acidiphila (strain ATCC BAA-1392 / DSM 18658 / VKM B-2454 / MOB10) GN=Sinac_6806 PE=4 SV=1: CTP_transf_1 [Gemmataceae bacterium]
MIRTRVLVGTVLALAAGGILVGDDHLAAGYFPCLFVCLMALGVIAGRELVALFPAPIRPSECLVVTGTSLCVAANWFPVAFGYGSVWPLVVFTLAGTVIAAMLLEMYRYTGEPGVVVPRLGTTMFAVAYIGVLSCFFVQVRFLPREHTAWLLALTIFVPKCNDIGAFFTGTFFGKHKMTPLLSPKKTWEGLAGGFLAGVAVAVGVGSYVPVFPRGAVEAVAFGLVVGLAGVLGDLAESLVKRDCQMKDAAKSIPGFGGLLDVVDAVLFAAPVAYLWFCWV